MSIPQLEVFLQTVELGSLTKAAEKLNYTQSGISHTIKTLEKKYETTLLIRDRSGVRLTSAGRELLPYIQAAFSSHRLLDEKVMEMNRMESGLIRVGTFTSVSSQWLPGIIQKFKAAYPKVHFELVHGNNEEIEQAIISGRLDCGFIKLPSTEKLHTTFLRRDPMVVVLAEDHPFSDKKAFPVEALEHFPYIEINEGIENEITRVFADHHIRPDVHYAQKDDYAVIAMVEKNLGITLLPELVLKDTIRNVVCRQLTVPAYRDIGIASPFENSASRLTNSFLSCTREWVEKEYEERPT
ncbi:LysR family transcriptional regulator [Alkalicoccus halolimnae]|uniref:LysR family transcriptional regulator n=1 Tax=Alkalicoccus halolimnae TaxID=1667239 RepID=A0A5C7FBH7_9BACI|nr:LysR family transcriptional regulator [Alkalicoccus halolimnae]TXF81560.1 LysR family transcriptional regulator [Alkalicoccus halolimnae]